MGLPLWPEYKTEKEAPAKAAVKCDPTAAARSTIRRRPSVHGRRTTRPPPSIPRDTEYHGARDANARPRHQSSIYLRQNHESGPPLPTAPPPVPDSRNYFAWIDPSTTRDTASTARASSQRRNDQREITQSQAETQSQVVTQQQALLRQQTLQQQRRLHAARSHLYRNRAPSRPGLPSDGFASTDRNTPQAMLMAQSQHSSHHARYPHGHLAQFFPPTQERTPPSGENITVRPRSQQDLRPAVLPSPPLEHSEGSDRPMSRRLPTPPSGWHSSLALPEHWVPASPSNGLGDRMRSPSPISQQDDVWEIMRATIQPDETLPSADSSFTGAAASASFATNRDNANPDVTSISQHHLAEPQEDYSDASAVDIECIDNSDADSNHSTDLGWPVYDLRPSTLEREETFNSGRGHGRDSMTADDSQIDDSTSRGMEINPSFSSREREYMQWLRSRQQAADSRHSDTDVPSPRPHRYGEDVRRTGTNVARSTRRFFYPEDGPLPTESVESIARPLATAANTDQVLPRSSLADTTNGTQSLANVLTDASQNLARDESDLEQMRGILERLARREDIPEEWWMSAGLNLAHTRDSSERRG